VKPLSLPKTRPEIACDKAALRSILGPPGRRRLGQNAGKDEMNETDARARKQSLYFPQDMLEEIKAEANRLERPLSWVVQRAWKRAREEIRKMPTG
jgi:uncharacterized small protein (TIGR04563 family)